MISSIPNHALQRFFKSFFFFANPLFFLSCWVHCQGAMTSCCNFSLIQFGLGELNWTGFWFETKTVKKLPLANSRGEDALKKKNKDHILTFFTSSFNCSSQSFCLQRATAAYVFIYETLLWRRFCCCFAVRLILYIALVLPASIHFNVLKCTNWETWIFGFLLRTE